MKPEEREQRFHLTKQETLYRLSRLRALATVQQHERGRRLRSRAEYLGYAVARDLEMSSLREPFVRMADELERAAHRYATHIPRYAAVIVLSQARRVRLLVGSVPYNESSFLVQGVGERDEEEPAALGKAAAGSTTLEEARRIA